MRFQYVLVQIPVPPLVACCPYLFEPSIPRPLIHFHWPLTFLVFQLLQIFLWLTHKKFTFRVAFFQVRQLYHFFFILPVCALGFLLFLASGCQKGSFSLTFSTSVWCLCDFIDRIPEGGFLVCSMVAIISLPHFLFHENFLIVGRIVRILCLFFIIMGRELPHTEKSNHNDPNN